MNDRFGAVRARLLRIRLWAGEHVPNRTTLILLLTLCGLLGAFFLALNFLRPPEGDFELRLDQVSALAENKRLQVLELRDQDKVMVGRFGPGDAARGIGVAGATFTAAYPSSDAVTSQLITAATQSGAQVAVSSQADKQAVRAVATYLLPLMILANLFALLFVRGGGGGMGAIEGFGTVRRGGRAQRHGETTMFTQVAGADEAVQELAEVVDYLKNPQRYQEIGALPPKGVLLFGPPGTGKTLLARAVAGEAGVPFFSVAGAEFVESLVGVGAARVRDLFARVRAQAPAIVFIDEIDAAGRRRAGGDAMGGADEREQTLNQLLVEMDGFEAATGLVVIAATNRPDILDPALLRPGRFDRHVTIEMPDIGGRERILQLHAANKPVGADVEWSGVARRTPGFSGADLANLVNEAALLALRRGRTSISPDDLEDATSRILHGSQSRGHLLSEEERRRAAAHEAGHALLAARHSTANGTGVPHRITIVGRGRQLGRTALQRTDQTLFSAEQLQARLAVLFGGTAAEEMLCGSVSTGSERDLEEATSLAREIVGRYGMSAALGPMRLLASDADEFLGGGGPTLSELAPATHERFDEAVRALLEEARESAERTVAASRETIEAISAELLEHETLDEHRLRALLNGALR